MKKVVLGILIVMFVVPAFAAVSQVVIDGRVRINIPVPDGFVDVTKTAPRVTSFFQETDTTNRVLAVLLSTEDAQSEDPELHRYLVIKVSPSVESHRITPRNFVEVRNYMRDQVTIDEMFESAGEELNQQLDKMGIQIGEMKYVPFDSESEKHIGISFLMNASAEVEGKRVDRIVASSFAMILAKERMFNIYVYSGYYAADDLIWTQNVLKNWAGAIIKAN